MEALTVKQQVEDLSAAGYAEASGSPQDSALRQFVAVGDHEPKPELDHALAFKKGEKVTLTSTAWEDDDDWVHGRTEDGRCGGFPPAKIGAPPPFPHVEPEPDCVQVRTGSVRGGAWGEFFEKVRDDELERRRKLQAAGGTAPHDSKIGVFVRPHPLRRRPRLPLTASLWVVGSAAGRWAPTSVRTGAPHHPAASHGGSVFTLCAVQCQVRRGGSRGRR